MPDEKDTNEESRRILDRIARESDGGSLMARTTQRAHDHLTAADADRSDWIEHLGTRIGRILGLVITIGLVVWLVAFLIRGG